MILIFFLIVIILLIAYQKASNKATDYEIKFEKSNERVKDLQNFQDEKISSKHSLILNVIQSLNTFSFLRFSTQINRPNLLKGKLTLNNKEYDCIFSIFQNYINLKISNNSGKSENDFYDKDYHFYYMSGDPTTEKIILDVVRFLEIRNDLKIKK